MTKKIKRHSRTQKKPSKKLFRSRGFIADFAIIILAVVLALFLIGNLFPKIPGTTNPLDQYEINATIDPTIHKNLQLKTFPFKKCLSSIAIDFLIDLSGSMDFSLDLRNPYSGRKVDNLSAGLRYFASKFSDNGAIAMQTFKTDAIAPIPNKIITAPVPFGLFKDRKTTFESAIAGFAPLGATYSRDAMLFTKGELDANKGNFPNHKFALVFISDGIPETAEGNNAHELANCQVTPAETAAGWICGRSTANGNRCRCLDPNQDPTDVAQQIKDSGIRIFTIRYLGDADAIYDQKLTEIMQRVATTPDDAYIAPINTQLDTVIDKITTKACQTLSPI